MELQNSTESEENKGKRNELLSPFEKILHEIGNEGRFQRFLFWGFIIPVAICNSLGNNNNWLLLITPKHTCYVPGKPDNVTTEKWMNLTIPWYATFHYIYTPQGV